MITDENGPNRVRQKYKSNGVGLIQFYVYLSSST